MMPKPFQRCLIPVLALLWLGSALGAEPAPATGFPYLVDVLGVSAGQAQKKLPSRAVIAVTQTRDGYLWLGTLNGLVRFDGDRFTVFDESNTPGLPSNRIVFLYEDRRGWLWAGTDGGGIALIRDGTVARLEFGAGSAGGRVVSACEDAEGGVWLYTADGQIGRFFGEGLELVARSGPSLCRSIISDSAGHIWVGTDQGQAGISAVATTNGVRFAQVAELKASRLDFLLGRRHGGFWRLADGRIERWGTNRLETTLASYPWTNSESVYVTCACEDLEGNLVVGVRETGVFWFDPEGGYTRISMKADEGGLSHATVLAASMDQEGNLWLGTDGGGVNRVKRRIGTVAPDTQGRVVQSACEGTDGSLWVGFNGGGILRSTGGRSKVFGWDGEFRRQDGLRSPTISSVISDGAGRVWVGTRGPGGLHQFRGDRFEVIQEGPDVNALYVDRTGKLWVGRPDGLEVWDGTEWKAYTTQEGLSNNDVRSIVEDRVGTLWVGTAGGGLNRMQEGRFTVYRKSPGELPGDNVQALLADADGAVWVGTGSGLARWKNGQWARITTAEGLVSDSIYYLVEDGEGFLWAGSNLGLMRMSKQSLEEFAEGQRKFVACRVYDEADGLPVAECTSGSQPAAIHTAQGRLWFPTIGGLVGIDPANLERNTNRPPVSIDSVVVDGRQLLTNGIRAPLPREVVLPASAERLEFHFASLNLAAPERALFRYQLEGHESSLSEPRASRVATFSKIPPGHYRFHVIAANEDGVWNEVGSSLNVIVLPPFWRTWWFLSGSCLAALGAIVGVVYWFSTQRLQRELALLRQKEALERERSRIARDLHDQLGANLTRVSLLGELVETDKNQPVEVETHARQISKTAAETAHALDEIVWAANPSNDTLEGLVNYLCKYAQEFLTTAGVRCRLDVPSHVPASPIPPDARHSLFLVVKEALNNVAKHAGASQVRFHIKVEPQRFVVELEDDGRGPADAATAANRGRNGLRNMRRRMEDVGGSFSIKAVSKHGTLVRLTAPLGED